MSITIDDGGLVPKDPVDVSVYEFDWGTKHLAAAVTIATSAFTVVAISPVAAVVPTLVETSPLGIQAGSRTTKVKVTGGTLGATYEITNTITTSETPAQTKNRMFQLLLENM